MLNTKANSGCNSHSSQYATAVAKVLSPTSSSQAIRPWAMLPSFRRRDSPSASAATGANMRSAAPSGRTCSRINARISAKSVMQTGKVAVKDSPTGRARTAGKITQSPAGQGGEAASCGPSKRLDLEAHHCALFAAELHADQVDGGITVTVFVGIATRLELGQRRALGCQLHHLELEQIHLPIEPQRHVQPPGVARLFRDDIQPQRREVRIE